MALTRTQPHQSPTLTVRFHLTVPHGYNHDTRLAEFRKRYHHHFKHDDLCELITDKKFSNASMRLTHGRQFVVDVYHIVHPMTSEECIAFLKTQDGVLLGAHGASLVWEFGKNVLPFKKHCLSFDEKHALPELAGNDRAVPFLRRRDNENPSEFKFSCTHFRGNGYWDARHALLCFRDHR